MLNLYHASCPPPRITTLFLLSITPFDAMSREKPSKTKTVSTTVTVDRVNKVSEDFQFSYCL